MKNIKIQNGLLLNTFKNILVIAKAMDAVLNTTHSVFFFFFVKATVTSDVNIVTVKWFVSVVSFRIICIIDDE